MTGIGDPAKRELAWQALTVFERAGVAEASAESDRSRESETDGTDPAAFFAEWRDRLGGDRETFERRLSLAGLSEESCAALVRRDSWPETEPLPDWAETADELVAHVARAETEVAGELGSEYPFEDALTPWVEYARTRRAESGEGLSAAALESLDDWLFRRLVEVSSEALFVEFKAFLGRREEDDSGDREGEGSVETDAEHYRAFVRELRSADGVRALFRAYPVLARFTAQTVRQWVGAVDELERRLAADRTRLRETVADGDSLGDVADLDVLTDDRHAGGRAVVELTFESGELVVYKPRSVVPEEYLNDAIALVNRRTDVDLETAACLSRDGYGWMERVPREDCASERAVSRYYRRAGALLALTYALGFTDCHFENVVASGDQPVVVDAETVMQPHLPREKLHQTTAADESNFTSVLRTGFLPLEDGDEEYSIGGFTAETVEARVARHEAESWRDVNTDAMEFVPERYRRVTGENLPTRGGEPVTIDGHRDAFEEGFEHVYRHLAERGSEFLREPDPDVEALPIRILVAPTKLYSSVIRAITSADCLSSGLAVTTKLESSVGDVFAGEIDDDLLQLYDWERDALVRTDVPRFTSRPTERRVRYRSETTSELVEESGYEATRERLDGFDSADLTRQLEHVETALDRRE